LTIEQVEALADEYPYFIDLQMKIMEAYVIANGGTKAYDQYISQRDKQISELEAPSPKNE
jgi:hypothetical protein